MGGIDIEPVGGMALQQCLDPVRELVSILRHVLGGDLEQRLFASERIRPGLPGLIAGPDRGVTAVPDWDRPLLVTRFFGAQRGQFRLEFGRFFGGDRRAGELTCERKQQYCHGRWCPLEFHLLPPDPGFNPIWTRRNSRFGQQKNTEQRERNKFATTFLQTHFN